MKVKCYWLELFKWLRFVPKAVLFKKCSLVYLSGGKVVEHLIMVLGYWLFLLDCGEGKRKKILFIETKSGQQPTLLPVHSFSKAAVFFFFFSYQELFASPRSLCFRTRFSQSKAFIPWIFSLQLPSEDSPNKRLTLWAFSTFLVKEIWCAGNSHKFCWYIILFSWVGVPGTSPMGETDE